MRKDILAAGARRANYFSSGAANDSVELKNVSPEGKDETVPTPAPVAIRRRQRFNPNPENYLVRQLDTAIGTYGSIDEALQSGTAKSEVVVVQEDKNKERPAEGFVVEAGDETRYAIGDHIVFGKYSGTEFKLNGEIFLLMREDEVLGSITEEDYDA